MTACIKSAFSFFIAAIGIAVSMGIANAQIFSDGFEDILCESGADIGVQIRCTVNYGDQYTCEGVMECKNTGWGQCILPEELHNGLDDDCDGLVDEDFDPFTLLSTNPESGASNVHPSAAVSAIFNYEIDLTSLSGFSFFVIPADGSFVDRLDGTISYEDSPPTIIFDPDQPLDVSTEYTARVTSDLEDIFGGSLQNDYSWNFTTGQF